MLIISEHMLGLLCYKVERITTLKPNGFAWQKQRSLRAKVEKNHQHIIFVPINNFVNTFDL